MIYCHPPGGDTAAALADGVLYTIYAQLLTHHSVTMQQPRRSLHSVNALVCDIMILFCLLAVNTLIRVTTCLENLEMSGNLTAVREMSGILLKVREMSGKKSCKGNCLKLFIVAAYLCPYRYLVGVYSVLNIKYMVSDHALLHSYPHH